MMKDNKKKTENKIKIFKKNNKKTQTNSKKKIKYLNNAK